MRSRVAESDPVIAVYRRDVDVSLLRENLKKTPEERLLALQELQRVAAELQRSGSELRKRKSGRADDLEAIAELEILAAIREESAPSGDE